MTIRIATEQDFEELIRLQFELYQKWDKIDEIDKVNKSRFYSDEHKDNMLENIRADDKRIFVSICNHKIRGYIIAEIKEREIFLDQVGNVAQVYTAPNHRKEGIGSKLFERAIGWFKEKNLKWVTVSTHSSDGEAIDFWQDKGFSEFNKNFKMNIR
jgi:GNAT superfamily N-acetyltransferase